MNATSFAGEWKLISALVYLLSVTVFLQNQRNFCSFSRFCKLSNIISVNFCETQISSYTFHKIHVLEQFYLGVGFPRTC